MRTEKRRAESVLITGGEGRLGRALSRRLLEKGFKVKALVKNRESVHTLPGGVIPYVGDVRNEQGLREACRGVDIVYHLAAVVSQYRYSAAEISRINAEGTGNMLEVSEEEGVERFIFSSSIDVYGIRRQGYLDEHSAVRPTDAYGRSKHLAEQIISKHSVDYTIFRLANIYGRGFEGSFFKLFRLIRDGKAYIIGSGRNHLALVHVDDAVNALILAAVKKNAGRIYNLSDGARHTQEELMGLAANLMGVERPRRHISAFIAKVFAKRHGIDTDELRFLTSDREINISLVKKELGFSPSVGIEKGGRELVEMFVHGSRMPGRLQ